MLFRAVFWIAIVSILIPREPNLGFGRPGASLFDTIIPQVSQAAASGRPCQGLAACASGLGMLQDLPAFGLRSLADVKADIDQAVRERKARGN
ncbi:MAG TPA: hypothetical protein VHU87_15400 [Rhizomicrobium sp.]|jgi:hypothetical protein|nr:hypothetical protein [Rhizomicrobium sp.]